MFVFVVWGLVMVLILNVGVGVVWFVYGFGCELFVLG